jgi:hypothetical protein
VPKFPDQSHQPIKPIVRERTTRKCPHFREFTATTFIQLNNPLSANSKKFQIRKFFIFKALQK